MNIFPAFTIYSSKANKHLYEKVHTYCIKIVDIVDPWYTPNISDVLCNIINYSMKIEKEYTFYYLII